MTFQSKIVNEDYRSDAARGLQWPPGLIRPAGRLIAWLLLFGLVSVDVAATDSEGGAWLVASNSDSFGSEESPSKWRWSLLGQLRQFTVGDGIRQGVVRGGLGYKVGNNVSLWGGYAYYHTKVKNTGTAREHRTWQQVSWTMGRWNWGTLKSRTRMEQRFRENRDGTGWWIRQRFSINVPIGGRDDLEFILGDESYFHLKDTAWSDSGWIQNRVFVMLGYKPSPKLKIEAGYLNQYFRVRGSSDLMNHLAVISFRFL